MNKKEPLLEISNLSVRYAEREVLRSLSLRIEAGETAALLGLNGSGKSTLLRAALGFLPIEAGEIRVDGQNLRTMPARERALRMGYIPQHSRFEGGLTVLELVLMGANAGMPLLGSYSRRQKAQALSCLEQLGIRDLSGCMLCELSQGQRQLAVFARTMMQQPKVFLLDEPDSALDLPRRREMMERVKEMAAETGSGALIVLHDASLALSCCDRVLILKDGRIACGLHMAGAQESEVRSAMRLLYGDVAAACIDGRWAVVG